MGSVPYIREKKNLQSKVNPGQGPFENALVEIENSIQASATAHLNWVTNYSL